MLTQVRPAAIAAVAALALAGCVPTIRLASGASTSPGPLPSLPAQPIGPTVTEGSYRVPGSVDATGLTDASAALQRFVDQVPNGATIEFPADGVYRMDHGLQLWRRHDLVFEGNGATLSAVGSPRRPGDSPFALMFGDERIVVRGFRLEGQNPDAGTQDAFHGGDEHLAGFYLGGVTDVLIEGVTITGFYGDCVYLGSNTSDVWSSRVVFRDSTCTRTGRHGVSVIAARDATIQRVTFDEIGFMIVDIEPDREEDGASSIALLDNTIGTYGLTDEYVSWVLAAYGGADGAPVDDVAIIGNSISGVGRTGKDQVALGLSVVADGRVGPRSGFVIRDNTSTRIVTRTDNGAPILIRNVTGVEVTGNRQPMSSGELAVFRNATGVVYGANDTAP